MDSSSVEVFLVYTCVPVLVGGAIWLWYLSKGLLQARALIVALWAVLLAMSGIAGGHFVIVMGSAAVMLGLIWWGRILGHRRGGRALRWRWCV